MWEMAITNFTHCHDRSLHNSGHPTLRRLSFDEIENMKDMTEAGQPTLSCYSIDITTNISGSCTMFIRHL